MKIALSLVKVLFVAVLLHLSTTILGDRYQGSFPPPGSFPSGTGSAPDNLRAEIIETLARFQEGYVNRDQAQLEPFVTRLFSPDNTVVLGTMPQEIYIGIDGATEIVRTDWQFWGDCRFDLDNAHVSVHGDVAWFSTIGYVEFDLSSLLVLPLRLSGVFVRENETWRFQHLQFQFDLDLSYLILINVLLALWLAINVTAVIIVVIRQLRLRSSSAPE